MKKDHRRLTIREKKYGENLRKIRKELRLSQDAIGEMLGCVQSYISAIENGWMPLTQVFAKVLIREFRIKHKKVIKPEEFGL